jgi:hypothetical protein
MGVSGQRHAPAALYLWEKTPGTHWIEGWMGLRSDLDSEAREKILCISRGSNPVVQSVRDMGETTNFIKAFVTEREGKRTTGETWM